MYRSCPWDVHKFTDYRSLWSNGHPEETSMGLLLHVNANGQAVEGFRIAVAGPTITTEFQGRDIFSLEILHNYTFKFEVEPHDVEIRPNSFTSKWLDLDDLLARGLITASAHGQKDDTASDVRRILENVKASDKDFG